MINENDNEEFDLTQKEYRYWLVPDLDQQDLIFVVLRITSTKKEIARMFGANVPGCEFASDEIFNALEKERKLKEQKEMQ